MTNSEYLEYLNRKSPNVVKSGFEVNEKDINNT